MQEVNVKREELLARIKANRSLHAEQFDKACNGFRKRVIEELDRMLEDAKRGVAFRLSVGLPEPVSHILDYDRAVTMLEMSTDPIIEISAHEFDMYVMDNWNWKAMTSTVNSMYLGTDNE